MARRGRLEVPSVHNDQGQGHGHRNFQKNCCVRSLQVPAAWDPEHNKTAAGEDQAGSPPASTPLRSPHFLEGGRRAVCAVYRTRNFLWPALYAAGKDADEENWISTYQSCADGAKAQTRSRTDVFPRGLANRVVATRGRGAVRGVRGGRRTHFGSALL